MNHLRFLIVVSMCLCNTQCLCNFHVYLRMFFSFIIHTSFLLFHNTSLLDYRNICPQNRKKEGFFFCFHINNLSFIVCMESLHKIKLSINVVILNSTFGLNWQKEEGWACANVWKMRNENFINYFFSSFLVQVTMLMWQTRLKKERKPVINVELLANIKMENIRVSTEEKTRYNTVFF